MHTEIETLWAELEIMKQITPHPNICNLLAYCTTPGILAVWGPHSQAYMNRSVNEASPLDAWHFLKHWECFNNQCLNLCMHDIFKNSELLNVRIFSQTFQQAILEELCLNQSFFKIIEIQKWTKLVYRFLVGFPNLNWLGHILFPQLSCEDVASMLPCLNDWINFRIWSPQEAHCVS